MKIRRKTSRGTPLAVKNNNSQHESVNCALVLRLERMF